MSRGALFCFGDLAAGAATGVSVTMVVRWLVAPEVDVVAAMMLGVVAGTVVHSIVVALLGPLLGMFEVMVPAMFIGMHGGMLFAMRESMQSVPQDEAILVGATFGMATVIVVRFQDAQFRRRSVADSDFESGIEAPDLEMEHL